MRFILALLLLVSSAVANDNAEKFPVPSNLDLKESHEIIEEVFGEQIKAASNTEAKAELAVKFLTTSAAASDRFEKYALLEKAQALAVEANDPQLYFRTLDAMDETFLIDKIKLWNDQLGKLMDGQVDETTLRKLAECDCVAADHPEKEAMPETHGMNCYRTLKAQPRRSRRTELSFTTRLHCLV